MSAPPEFVEASRVFAAAKEAAAAVRTPIFVLYGVTWETRYLGDATEEVPQITEKQRAFSREELEAAVPPLMADEMVARDWRTLWLIREHLLCADGTLLPAEGGGLYTVTPWYLEKKVGYYEFAIRKEPLVWRPFQEVTFPCAVQHIVSVVTTDPAPVNEDINVQASARTLSARSAFVDWLSFDEPEGVRGT